MKNVQSDLFLIERVAEKHISERQFLFITNLEFIAPFECFKAVVVDETNVILLILKENIDINREFTISAFKLSSNDKGINKIMPKKIAINVIFEQAHIRKNHLIAFIQ